MNNTHIIKIGELYLGRHNDIIKATLGSCVGIGIFWQEKKMIGFAHCLLPETQTPSTQLGAKYVNQAVLSLMTMMKIHLENLSEIRALIVGGGYMMAIGNPNKKHIGTQNIEAARKYLEESGVKIFFEDVGGIEGRQIEINCKSEEFIIKKIQRK